jgi:hypothetical protein
MRLRHPALLLFLACSFISLAQSTISLAQTTDPEPKRNDAPVPVVMFDFNFPGGSPAHYSISVESTGRASYRSDAGTSSGDQQPYTSQFTISDAVKRQIFDLAKQTHYFQGDFEYHGGRVANTGSKTLTYSEGAQRPDLNNPTNGKSTHTTYNYSQNPAIQQLTAIFQKISATLEFGNRLEHEHRFDRMSLEGELKRMEEMLKSHDLLELQSIGTVLRDIANDSAIFNVTRERAMRLYRAGEGQVASK